MDLPCHDTQAQTAAGTPESQHDQSENHSTLKNPQVSSVLCTGLRWGCRVSKTLTVSQSTGTRGRRSSNHSPFYKYRLWSSTPSRIFKLQHRDPGDQYFSWQPPELLLRIFGEAVKAGKFCFFKSREMAGLNDQKGFQLPTK